MASLAPPGPLVIPFDVFRGCVAAPPPRMLALAAKLVNYACFSAPARQEGNRRAGRRPDSRRAGVRMMDRPRIGLRELSRADLCRKEFLSLMNKLSPQNYAKIWKGIACGLVPEHAAVYCDVLWSLMHRQSRMYLSMYAEISWSIARTLVSPHKLAFKACWDDKWRTWCGDDGGAAPYWHVGDAQHALAAMATSASEDEFNELLAWKKSRLCVIQACAYLCNKGVLTVPIDVILAPVVDKCAAGLEGSPAFLDYYLDLISNILDVLKELKQPVPVVLGKKWTRWQERAAHLPSLCRFKIIALIENHPHVDRGPDREQPGCAA